ncbi:Protein of unknown function (DUF3727) [Fragilaria crotonensis]|nr:Protein of unknown function (DUF3727) [Fragilaria crotonensis]
MRSASASILIVLLPSMTWAFSPIAAFAPRSLYSATKLYNELHVVSNDDSQVPIPFMDLETNSFIECYVDAVAKVDGVEYTIGVPCDHAVALCYFDDDDQLVPVELEEDLMDDVFPIAESIVAEEFGEELVLQRTPQTLTLVGELDEDDDEDQDEDDDDDSDSDEEEVEVLLSFEHRDMEFNLVRLLDPVLLVGKEVVAGQRVLLSPDESEKVMPELEKMFLDFHGEEE